jgi:hypothetical protein
MSSCSLVLVIMCISDMSSCSLVLVIMCISVVICPPVSLHLYTLSPEQDCRRTYRYNYTHYHHNKTAGGHIATLLLQSCSGDNVYKCSDMSSCSLVLVIMCISEAIITTLIHIITRTRLQEDISLQLYTLSPEQDCRRTYRYTYAHYHQNKTCPPAVLFW